MIATAADDGVFKPAFVGLKPANAFGAENDNYLESGIDETLVKPVRPQALYRCVLKWLPA